MSTTSPGTLSVTRRFDFAMERVFDAWLDPAQAARFLFATPTGTMVRAEIDPRVSGKFNFTERRDGVDIEHVGTYVEINRPTRLVFTFGVPLYSPDFVRVCIDQKPVPGGCELTLTQQDTPAEYVERTREGWAKILESLAMCLSKQGEGHS
jgi:uncharacterized protein YndB with AHSA1/START domain